MSEIEDLKKMLSHFRVNDLQQLLMYAGRSKYGKKAELLERAITLLTDCPAPMKIKIKDLYKKVINTTYGLQQYRKVVMPPPGGGEDYSTPVPPYNTHPQNHFGVGSEDAPPTFVYGTGAARNQQHHQQQQHAAYLHNVLQHHHSPAGGAGYIHGRGGTILSKMTPPPAASLPIQPDVRFKALPFYERLRELIKPTTLVPVTVDKNVPQENFFIFHLSPQMVDDIIGSKFVCPATGKIDYSTQIQLRICGYDINNEQEDNFPSNISVKVNGASTPLPLPLPPKAPSLDPKRPGRPLNITPSCKLSSLLENQINISWTNSSCNVYLAHVMAVFLVKKISTKTLLQRLRTKGIRDSDVTKALIKEKLKSGTDDLEIATTSLRISLICPLSKCPMVYACRASTCKHFQCFDADTFLLMNEKNAKWMCPVCHQPALYSNLMIDGLFMEILDSSPASTEIEFFQDASWTAVVIDGSSPCPGSSLANLPKMPKGKGQGTSSSMPGPLEVDPNDASVLQVLSDHKSSSDEVRSLIRSDLEDYEEDEDDENDEEQPINIIPSTAGHRSILANPSYLCSSPSVSSSDHSDDETRDLPRPRDSGHRMPSPQSRDVDVIDLCSSPEAGPSSDFLPEPLSSAVVPSSGYHNLEDQLLGEHSYPPPPSTTTLKSTSLFYDFTDITMDDDDDTDPNDRRSPLTDFRRKRSRADDFNGNVDRSTPDTCQFQDGHDFFDRGGETMADGEETAVTLPLSFPASPPTTQDVLVPDNNLVTCYLPVSSYLNPTEFTEPMATSTFFIYQRPYLASCTSPNLITPSKTPLSLDLGKTLSKCVPEPWTQAKAGREDHITTTITTPTDNSEILTLTSIDGKLAASVAERVCVTQHRAIDNIFQQGGPLVKYPTTDQSAPLNQNEVPPCIAMKSPEIEAADREIARNIFTLMQNDMGVVMEQQVPRALTPSLPVASALNNAQTLGAGSKIDAVCAEMMLKRSSAKNYATLDQTGASDRLSHLTTNNVTIQHSPSSHMHEIYQQPPVRPLDAGTSDQRALYRKRTHKQNQPPPPLKLITQASAQSIVAAQPLKSKTIVPQIGTTSTMTKLQNVTYVSQPPVASFKSSTTTSNPFRWTSNGPYRAIPQNHQQQLQQESYGATPVGGNHYNIPPPNTRGLHPFYPFPPNQRLRYFPPPIIPTPNSSFFAAPNPRSAGITFYPQHHQQHLRPSAGPTLFRNNMGNRSSYDRSGGPSGSNSSDPTSKIQAIVDNVFERIQTTKKPYS